jgi:hypothetical protein
MRKLISCTGMTQWPLYEGQSVIWMGPGSGLYLVFGSTMTRIEHPTASGQYDTRKSAENAIKAFLASPSPEGRPVGK